MLYVTFEPIVIWSSADVSCLLFSLLPSLLRDAHTGFHYIMKYKLMNGWNSNNENLKAIPMTNQWLSKPKQKGNNRWILLHLTVVIYLVKASHILITCTLFLFSQKKSIFIVDSVLIVDPCVQATHLLSAGRMLAHIVFCDWHCQSNYFFYAKMRYCLRNVFKLNINADNVLFCSVWLFGALHLFLWNWYWYMWNICNTYDT